MGMPVWITDAAGHVFFLNQRAEAFFGHSRSDWLGKPCHVAIGGVARDGSFCCPPCRNRRAGLARVEIEPVRMQVVLKDGRPAEVCVAVIAVDGPTGAQLVHCVVDDERERRLRRFLNGVMDHVAPPKGGRAPTGSMLTPREREVLSLLAEDLNTREIADRLSVSYATVRNHVQRVLTKLRVHSIMEAVAVWVMEEDGRSKGR